jgi:carboxyl-terminal processing protease
MVNHQITEDFKVDDVVIGEFKQFLTSENIPFTNEDFNAPMDWVKANIKAELLATQYGQLQGLRVRADWDPMIQKAVTYLPEAQALEDTAHKVLAEKAEARSGSTN